MVEEKALDFVPWLNIYDPKVSYKYSYKLESCSISSKAFSKAKIATLKWVRKGILFQPHHLLPQVGIGCNQEEKSNSWILSWECPTLQLWGVGGRDSYLRNCFCLTRCKVLIRNQNILSIWASQRTKESSAVYDNITDFVTPWKKWAQLLRIRGKHLWLLSWEEKKSVECASSRGSQRDWFLSCLTQSTYRNGIRWIPGDHREQKRINKQKRIDHLWQPQRTCNTIDRHQRNKETTSSRKKVDKPL